MLSKLLRAVFVLGLAACGRAPEPPSTILLVTVDTLRADRLGAWGSELDLTPALDALAARSIVFRHAYTTASYTLPAMSALMTGRFPEELGLLTNLSLVQAKAPTLAEILQEDGWRTAAVVSNYVLRDAAGTGIENGFAWYDCEYPQREATRGFPERTAGSTTDAALAMLDRLRGGDAGARTRAFLWVHYQDPHGPYFPPDGLRERHLEHERAAPDAGRLLTKSPVQDGLGKIPDYQHVPGEDHPPFYRAGYDGEVEYVDREIGRLLAGLDERGLSASTALFFTADHGESLGEDDYWFSHGELVTDPTVHVPLLAMVPGHEPGVRTDAATTLDLFATILSVAGARNVPDSRARDLLAPGAASRESTVYVSAMLGGSVPRFALVAGGYKYLVAFQEGRAEERLHRLGAESVDLAGDAPDVVRNLRDLMHATQARLETIGTERRQDLSPRQKQMLDALGYSGD